MDGHCIKKKKRKEYPQKSEWEGIEKEKNQKRKWQKGK